MINLHNSFDYVSTYFGLTGDYFYGEEVVNVLSLVSGLQNTSGRDEIDV